MVEIITGIIDLLIIAGVVFAVLFIRKRLKLTLKIQTYFNVY